ncbi:MAG: alpha-galactosidase, partial [Microbacteriaceae bacterium]|nr:alpha-galactosidase [Microbacteriaceae bacterium]
YVTETDASQGDVDVYVDGAFKQTVSTYRDPALGRAAQQAVYSISGLPNGTHTLRVVKKSGSYMLLDKLDVTLESLLSATTATFDKSAPADVSVDVLRDPGELAAISYGGKTLQKGTDYRVSGNTVTIGKAYLAALPIGDAALAFQFRGDYHNDVHYTARNGDSVSFTFQGTGVQWITAMGPDQGAVDVYVDGTKVKRVDTHNATRVTGREVFAIDRLKDGKHTFKAVKVSGDVMRNDVIRYTTS